ncbi:MAG: helix-turn-helix domain-containing protein, partial [Thermodesulfobacteriota bacterium]
VMMENVEEVKRKSKGKESRFGKRYGFELKLRCVKLRLEEGLPVSLLSKEWGVSKDVVYRWVRAYQERGEAGLRNQVRSSESRRRLPGSVREKIIRQNPLAAILIYIDTWDDYKRKPGDPVVSIAQYEVNSKGARVLVEWETEAALQDQERKYKSFGESLTGGPPNFKIEPSTK